MSISVNQLEEARRALDAPLFADLAGDAEMSFAVPFFGSALAAPLWTNLAAFDFTVKAFAALVLLAPYGALMNVVMPYERAGHAR